MAKPVNPSKRIDTPLGAYRALHDALDLVKSVQAAGLRGVLPADRTVAEKISEARAAIDAAIAAFVSECKSIAAADPNQE